MRKLILRDHHGHRELDLDTDEAIRELEQGMNNGMLAIAVRNADLIQLETITDPAIQEATEIRLMWPLAGG